MFRYYSQDLPTLKEEYNRWDCELVLIMSEDYAKKIDDSIMNTETYFNVRVNNEEEIFDVQEKVEEIVPNYEMIQNRVQEEISDTKIRQGMRNVIEVLAGLLACIGLANVFSNTLSQVIQRKREFARYISIGLSKNGLKKILIYEDLIISLRPVIISIIINIPIVLLLLNQAKISLTDFFANMPMAEIGIFTGFILIVVSIAYYIGGRKILKGNIVEMLKDDTLY